MHIGDMFKVYEKSQPPHGEGGGRREVSEVTIGKLQPFVMVYETLNSKFITTHLTTCKKMHVSDRKNLMPSLVIFLIVFSTTP
jgi:hypothetical protein